MMKAGRTLRGSGRLRVGDDGKIGFRGVLPVESKAYTSCVRERPAVFGYLRRVEVHPGELSR